MKTVLSLLAGLIVLVLAIISVQNPTPVALRFLGWQTAVLPLWVVIVAALACGMALVGLLAVPGRIQRFRTTRRLRTQLAEADTTITTLDQQVAHDAQGSLGNLAEDPALQPAALRGPSAERDLPGHEQLRPGIAHKP